jgi:hypothetical protein
MASSLYRAAEGERCRVFEQLRNKLIVAFNYRFHLRENENLVVFCG